ncbi:MAG: hypothetical protein IPL03_17325 [Sterolibacteriaceae bacterium]|nr:hypothetical protein [Candidatus Methylophosphatis haderslevensis]
MVLVVLSPLTILYGANATPPFDVRENTEALGRTGSTESAEPPLVGAEKEQVGMMGQEAQVGSAAIAVENGERSVFGLVWYALGVGCGKRAVIGAM